MRRVFVDPDAPQRDAIEEAAKWIRNGGVVAMPTDTLYGLAADPFRADAVARVFAVKGRAAERALPLDRRRRGAGRRRIWARCRRRRARLAERFWPGPLTLLVAGAARAGARRRPAAPARVGVRVPAHGVARALCRACGRPVTATSANLSGEPATADPDEVERTLGDRIDLLIDAGRDARRRAVDDRRRHRAPSRALVRAGAIPWDEIQAWLNTGRGVTAAASAPRSSA